MTKADLDWANLDFGYHKTDFNIRYMFRNGQWDEGVLTPDETVPMHIAATCLHYGQGVLRGTESVRDAARRSGRVPPPMRTRPASSARVRRS